MSLVPKNVPNLRGRSAHLNFCRKKQHSLNLDAIESLNSQATQADASVTGSNTLGIEKNANNPPSSNANIRDLTI
jgi:hypothetical protein